MVYKLVFTLGAHYNWVERYDTWYPWLNNILAIASGVGAVYGVSNSLDRKEFHLSVVSELRRVTWPSVTDTKRMTLVVVVVVAVFSVILSIFDVLWAKLLALMLP